VIRVPDPDLAEDIYRKLKRGWSFIKLAENYSNFRDSGEKGQIVRRPLPEFPERFQQNLELLQPGRFTKVMSTQKGNYIYRLEKKYPERILPLEDVRDTLRQELIARASSRKFRAWLETRVQKIEITMGTPIRLKKEKK